MKDRKLMEKVAEEMFQSSNKDTVFKKISQTLESRKEKNILHSTKIYRMLAIAISMVVLLTITFSIMHMLKPEEEQPNLNNNNGIILSPTPIVFGYENLESVSFNSLEELQDIYAESLELSGFKPEFIIMYHSSDDAQVPVYLNIIYHRETLFDAPWDMDTINLIIILVNDYEYEYSMQYENVNQSFSLTINDQLQTYHYYEEGDLGDGEWDLFSRARIKIFLNDIEYYISTEYFAPFEEGNRIQNIVEELLS